MRTPNQLLLPIVILAFIVAACSSAATESGDLVAVIDPTGETVGFLDFGDGETKTFGVFVCAADETVTLDSVESLEIEGDVRIVGAMVLTGEEGFVGAVNGFPPVGTSESAVDVEGATVSLGCAQTSGPRSQILIGAERTGTGGGVIHGFRVNHSGGYLSVPAYTIILCGDDFEFCENLRSEDST